MTTPRISTPGGPNDLPRLFTAADVARDTGLGLETVYRLERRGELPSVRIGRSVRFPEPAVRAWIERGGRAG